MSLNPLALKIRVPDDEDRARRLGFIVFGAIALVALVLAFVGGVVFAGWWLR